MIEIGKKYTLSNTDDEGNITDDEEGVFTPLITESKMSHTGYKVCLIRNLYNNLVRWKDAIYVEDFKGIGLYLNENDIPNLIGHNRVLTPID